MSRRRLNGRNVPRKYGIQEQRRGTQWCIGREEVSRGSGKISGTVTED